MFNTILYFFKNINIKLFLKVNMFYNYNLYLIKNNLMQFISIFYQNKNIKVSNLKFYFFFQKNQMFESILFFLMEILFFIVMLEFVCFLI